MTLIFGCILKRNQLLILCKCIMSLCVPVITCFGCLVCFGRSVELFCFCLVFSRDFIVGVCLSITLPGTIGEHHLCSGQGTRENGLGSSISIILILDTKEATSLSTHSDQLSVVYPLFTPSAYALTHTFAMATLQRTVRNTVHTTCIAMCDCLGVRHSWRHNFSMCLAPLPVARDFSRHFSLTLEHTCSTHLLIPSTMLFFWEHY